MSRLRASSSDSWTLFAMGICRGGQGASINRRSRESGNLAPVLHPPKAPGPRFRGDDDASAQHANLQLRVVARRRKRRDGLIAGLRERVLERTAAARRAFELA